MFHLVICCYHWMGIPLYNEMNDILLRPVLLCSQIIQEVGIDPPKTVLVMGRSGTGKTTIVIIRMFGKWMEARAAGEEYRCFGIWEAHCRVFVLLGHPFLRCPQGQAHCRGVFLAVCSYCVLRPLCVCFSQSPVHHPEPDPAQRDREGLSIHASRGAASRRDAPGEGGLPEAGRGSRYAPPCGLPGAASRGLLAAVLHGKGVQLRWECVECHCSSRDRCGMPVQMSAALAEAEGT